MQKHILADTSRLIFLDKINRINWLHELYGKLIIPLQVSEEYGAPLNYLGFSKPQVCESSLKLRRLQDME